ncbi:MAG: hypothetical protein KDK48_02800 [Chlamydiia bacterium]|nr:hypothetical protein [Chlamydiia bacterium]
MPHLEKMLGRKGSAEALSARLPTLQRDEAQKVITSLWNAGRLDLLDKACALPWIISRQRSVAARLEDYARWDGSGVYKEELIRLFDEIGSDQEIQELATLGHFDHQAELLLPRIARGSVWIGIALERATRLDRAGSLQKAEILLFACTEASPKEVAEFVLNRPLGARFRLDACFFLIECDQPSKALKVLIEKAVEKAIEGIYPSVELLLAYIWMKKSGSKAAYTKLFDALVRSPDRTVLQEWLENISREKPLQGILKERSETVITLAERLGGETELAKTLNLLGAERLRVLSSDKADELCSAFLSEGREKMLPLEIWRALLQRTVNQSEHSLRLLANRSLAEAALPFLRCTEPFRDALKEALARGDHEFISVYLRNPQLESEALSYGVRSFLEKDQLLDATALLKKNPALLASHPAEASAVFGRLVEKHEVDVALKLACAGFVPSSDQVYCIASTILGYDFNVSKELASDLMRWSLQGCWNELDVEDLGIFMTMAIRTLRETQFDKTIALLNTAEALQLYTRFPALMRRILNCLLFAKMQEKQKLQVVHFREKLISMGVKAEKSDLYLACGLMEHAALRHYGIGIAREFLQERPKVDENEAETLAVFTDILTALDLGEKDLFPLYEQICESLLPHVASKHFKLDRLFSVLHRRRESAPKSILLRGEKVRYDTFLTSWMQTALSKGIADAEARISAGDWLAHLATRCGAVNILVTLFNEACRKTYGAGEHQWKNDSVFSVLIHALTTLQTRLVLDQFFEKTARSILSHRDAIPDSAYQALFDVYFKMMGMMLTEGSDTAHFLSLMNTFERIFLFEGQDRTLCDRFAAHAVKLMNLLVKMQNPTAFEEPICRLYESVLSYFHGRLKEVDPLTSIPSFLDALAAFCAFSSKAVKSERPLEDLKLLELPDPWVQHYLSKLPDTEAAAMLCMHAPGQVINVPRARMKPFLTSIALFFARPAITIPGMVFNGFGILASIWFKTLHEKKEGAVFLEFLKIFKTIVEGADHVPYRANVIFSGWLVMDSLAQKDVKIHSAEMYKVALALLALTSLERLCFLGTHVPHTIQKLLRNAYGCKGSNPYHPLVVGYFRGCMSLRSETDPSITEIVRTFFQFEGIKDKVSAAILKGIKKELCAVIKCNSNSNLKLWEEIKAYILEVESTLETTKKRR